MGTTKLTGIFLGFAKSRPAAQRPTARDGLAARQPSGPRPMAQDGPVAQWPSPDFPQFFCSVITPRACTDLHQVWACKMDDGEFEFGCHFDNHFSPFFGPFFGCLLLSEKRHSLFHSKYSLKITYIVR